MKSWNLMMSWMGVVNYDLMFVGQWHAFPLLLDVTGTLRILRLYMALHLLRCILDLLVLLQPAVTSKFNMSIIQHAESELIL